MSKLIKSGEEARKALEGDLTTCLDGESMHSQCVTLKLADKKVNFFAPKGCDPDATAR